MPALEDHIGDRNQTVVVWPANGFTRDDGRPSVGTPRQLQVRLNRTKRQTQDSKGNTVTLDATVIVAQTEDIPIGSYIWQGELEDLAGTGSGQVTGIDILDILFPTEFVFGSEDAATSVRQDVMEVVSQSYTQDLKGRNVRRELGLQRLHEVTA